VKAKLTINSPQIIWPWRRIGRDRGSYRTRARLISRGARPRILSRERAFAVTAAKYKYRLVRTIERRRLWPLQRCDSHVAPDADQHAYGPAFLDGFMPEPECDHRLIDAMVQQFHCGAVPEDMQAHAFSYQRGTRPRSRKRMPSHDEFESITAELGPSDGQEERIAVDTGSFPEPDFQNLERFLSQRRTALFASLALATDVGSRAL